MDIDLHAEDSPLSLWIEPWGDLITVDAGETVRLVLDGDLIESLSFSSVSGGLTVSVPRYGRLAVAAEDGERLREYDANNIPPVPDGFRP